MSKKVNKSSLQGQQSESKEKSNPQGYPLYPDNEDIYKNYQEEKEVDPEDTSKSKEPKEINRKGASNEKDFNDDFSGSDLDIPGSELDDEQENIGSEDEENNYYSLGGDDHDDLDEDNGE